VASFAFAAFARTHHHTTTNDQQPTTTLTGWIFVLLSVSGMRSGLLTLVPRSTMLATAGGIGLFLAFIGCGWMFVCFVLFCFIGSRHVP
jgi:hypothetical protein